MVPFTPKAVLFCWFDSIGCIKQRYALINFITAASILFAKTWKQGDIPAVREWRAQVYFICFMSKLIAYSRLLADSVKAMEIIGNQWHLYIISVVPEKDRLL